MLCSEFEDRLESWFCESLGEPLQEACSAHVASCPSCAELVTLMEISSTGVEPWVGSDAASSIGDPVPPDFLLGVLEATSGTPCRGIEEQLVASYGQSGWVSASTLSSQLSPWSREHLTECRPCRSLEAALEMMRRELPALATLPVGTDFTGSVLRRTLPPRQRFVRWFRSRARRWLARPRFATELAYALTVVLMVLVGNPSAPLRALSDVGQDLATPQRLESELKSVATSVQGTPAWGVVEDTLQWANGWWEAGRETVRSVWIGGFAFGESLLHTLSSGDDGSDS